MRILKLLLATLCFIFISGVFSETPILTNATPQRISSQLRHEYYQKSLKSYQKRNLKDNVDKIARMESNRIRSGVSERSNRLNKRKTYLEKREEYDNSRFGVVEGDVRPHLSMSPSSLSEGHRKTMELLALAAEAPDGMIFMNTQQINKYVLASPRPYHLQVTFTALGSNWTCGLCQLLHKAQSIVFSTLQKAYSTISPDVEPNTLYAEEYPVFSVVIDANKNMQLWRSLKITQAPTALVVPPSFSHSRRFPVEQLLHGSFPKITLSPSISASDIASSLNKITHSHIPLPQASINFKKLVLLMLLPIASLAGLYFLHQHSHLSYHLRLAALFINLCVYIYFTAGYRWNSINNAPFNEMGRHGPVYVAAGFQRQVGAETLLVAVCYSVSLVVFVLLVGLAHYQSLSRTQLNITVPVYEDPDSIVDDTKTDSVIAGGLYSLLKQASGVAVLCVFIVVYVQLCGLFTTKNPNYNMGFV